VSITRFFVDAFTSALDRGIASSHDLIRHFTPEVLAAHLPRPLWARLLTACLGAARVDATTIVDTVGVANLCEHLPKPLLWTCLAELAAAALSGAAIASPPKPATVVAPSGSPEVLLPPPPASAIAAAPTATTATAATAPPATSTRPGSSPGEPASFRHRGRANGNGGDRDPRAEHAPRLVAGRDARLGRGRDPGLAVRQQPGAPVVTAAVARPGHQPHSVGGRGQHSPAASRGASQP
jgi:hypothetical protein